jgi:IclR family acetate operon transcriptional repressor
MPPVARQATRRIAVVGRALAVLDALADADGELGTNEIARRTGVNASSVSRLLATLADGGVVEQAANGRYRLGLRLLQLGNAVLERLDLRTVARAPLEALVQATGETATLSVAGEHEAVTVDFVRSPASVQGVAQLGRPSVAHATAAGKAVLAFGLATVPPGPLRRFTPRTITHPGAVAREIDQARAQGWAEAVGEREDDLAALAAPVFSARDELVAVIGLQGPVSRFDEEARARALPHLLEAAAELSRRLGSTRSAPVR